MTFGYYTLGLLFRIVNQLFDLQISNSFGYVPIYKDLTYGFNSFTYITYVVYDFGIVFSLFFSFLLGFSISHIFLKLKRYPNPYYIIIFIMLFILLLLGFRDITSKWFSWGIILILSIIIIKVGGVKCIKY